jgi:hypothetical protein
VGNRLYGRDASLRLETELTHPTRPGHPRERAAQRRHQRSISPRQLRPRGLSAEDRELMAEDEDLELLRATRPAQQPHQGEQVPDNEIHKRPEQAASLDHDTNERRN